MQAPFVLAWAIILALHRSLDGRGRGGIDLRAVPLSGGISLDVSGGVHRAMRLADID